MCGFVAVEAPSVWLDTVLQQLHLRHQPIPLTDLPDQSHNTYLQQVYRIGRHGNCPIAIYVGCLAQLGDPKHRITGPSMLTQLHQILSSLSFCLAKQHARSAGPNDCKIGIY
jgi:hypothetical protein